MFADRATLGIARSLWSKRDIEDVLLLMRKYRETFGFSLKNKIASIFIGNLYQDSFDPLANETDAATEGQLR
jgi:hypothetical protein